ncbi:kelch domain-containing protein 3-like isoform X2 [Xenia sp. Carnegie-2017]|uniref:kelch domain-containing protein 3-like isoform X2 n=1 Tax=Xenia sp. Carnegie-2017 TaxID=2897299 RepID=UPI001F040414|nr:kelch domain-containing protein 3-like isoform X2 [Xenia sp. Carnegie-2017]
MRWTVVCRDGPRRVNHAAVAVNDRYVFTFGGFCSGEDYTRILKMDVHMFDLHKLKWMKVSNVESDDYDSTPFMRYGHTASIVGRKIYIFGGRNEVYGACNRVFTFGINTFKWSIPNVYGTIPPPHDGHSACVIACNIYIFGGYTDWLQRYSKDIYIFNTEKLTWTHPQGEAPSWRDFHTATAMGKYMYIFGGRGDMMGEIHSNQDVYDNKIVAFDTDKYTWQHIKTSGSIPLGRRSHSAVARGNCIYMFGGYNGSLRKHFNDIIKFNTDTKEWNSFVVSGEHPCPRRRHTCCILQDKVIIYGGSSPVHFDEYEGERHLQDHNDLFVLDFNPSLKTLCQLALLKNRLDYNLLPPLLRKELALMSTKTSQQEHHTLAQG